MEVREIIIHCTATPDGKDYTVEQIRKWHTAKPPKGNGWDDIGYHYVIDRYGKINTGRSSNIPGAHCKGHNSISLGIAYVGGLSSDGKTPKDTRTDAQKKSLINLLKRLKQLHPNAKIYGHNNFSAKPCPCFNAKAEYANL